jgi:Tfp pilus assembly protein PilN
MIKINLLPQEMAGRGARATRTADDGQALVALLLIVLLIANLGVGGFFLYERSQAQKQRDIVKAERDKVAEELRKTKIEFDEINSSLENMRRLIELAESLDPEDRLLWSRKLNALPLLVPEGVFLSEIQVVQKITEVETDESVAARTAWARTRRGPQPPVERVPSVTQTLTLKGIAYVEGGTATQRLDQITLFFRNLREKKVRLPFDQAETSFMDGLANILPSPVETATLQGRQVNTFTFTLNSRATLIK